MSPDIIAQRIAIAKDVLQLIKLINVTPGCYIYHKDYGSLDHSLPLKESMDPKFLRSCNTCAIGGMFLGYVRLYNSATVKDCRWLGRDYDEQNIPKPLLEIFGIRQLAIIEAAFEGKIYGDKGIYDFEFTELNFINLCGQRWNNKYSPHDRLKYICLNIIRNKGYFIFPRDIAREANHYLSRGCKIEGDKYARD